MRIPIKHFIRKISEVFGYQITRTSKPPEAFSVQKDLINNTEPVIFDIGAHIGDVARLYGNIFPHARIYCFEPSPCTFDILCRTTSGDSRILCYQQAICETTGKGVLNENVSDATNSLLATDDRASLSWGGGVQTTSQCEVLCNTLDHFCFDQHVHHIDILKMDVQGAEYKVLDGARQMLTQQRVSLIYMEIIICPTYREQRKFHDYLANLDSFGYELLDLFSPIRAQGKLIQVDAIFLSRAFEHRLRPVNATGIDG